MHKRGGSWKKKNQIFICGLLHRIKPRFVLPEGSFYFNIIIYPFCRVYIKLLVNQLLFCRYKEPKFIDPLKRALDRGSAGLDLLNSPLVLDYVHVKFTGTLPSWLSRNPFQPTVNEGHDRLLSHFVTNVRLNGFSPVYCTI